MVQAAPASELIVPWGLGTWGLRPQADELAIGPEFLHMGSPQDHLQVEAIEQGAAEFAPVALAPGLTADTGPLRVAVPAAGAGVGGGHQGHGTGKAQSGPGAADPHLPFLQGLAQLVEHIAAKFSQLIEEQHAVVGQGQIARPGNRAAADQGRA